MRASSTTTGMLMAGAFALMATGACDEMPTDVTGDQGAEASDLPVAASTTVPGHTGNQGRKTDADDNGIPDEGVVVNGHYTSVYAYDANGDYYWDLGDGRVRGTVDSVDELDQSTLTVCDYVVNYRGTFENDPFMDTGWIQNHINCKGFDDNRKYHYLIVHETDPRYTGNGTPTFGGDWEYHGYVVSGFGNLLNPHSHVGS